MAVGHRERVFIRAQHGGGGGEADVDFLDGVVFVSITLMVPLMEVPVTGSEAMAEPAEGAVVSTDGDGGLPDWR